MQWLVPVLSAASSVQWLSALCVTCREMWPCNLYKISAGENHVPLIMQAEYDAMLRQGVELACKVTDSSKISQSAPDFYSAEVRQFSAKGQAKAKLLYVHSISKSGVMPRETADEVEAHRVVPLL